MSIVPSASSVRLVPSAADSWRFVAGARLDSCVCRNYNERHWSNGLSLASEVLGGRSQEWPAQLDPSSEAQPPRTGDAQRARYPA